MPTSDPSPGRLGQNQYRVSRPWLSGVGVDTRRITFLITYQRPIFKEEGKNLNVTNKSKQPSPHTLSVSQELGKLQNYTLLFY